MIQLPEQAKRGFLLGGWGCGAAVGVVCVMVARFEPSIFHPGRFWVWFRFRLQVTKSWSLGCHGGLRRTRIHELVGDKFLTLFTIKLEFFKGFDGYVPTE